ncbi:Polysaccharide deacetylase [Corynebacterium imitans]|uniref:Polysaccharide deacetylase n=1 Tax=Corynebacterium imitans TaxID=156978 RepID=A0A076NG91_9CORY|nr:polysaccharide deacetylase family protein [Corynebacterium imitans]AIJ33469.1 hypothetical protein CIMIT_05775 [Corynebacterium imitans]SNV70868.1 Polysaccharide deacetylase [Corynebacterium imitans]
MAEITVEGTLADVTARPVSEVTSVTAKAARPTPVAGGLITTEPVHVDYSAESGTIRLTLTAGVKSWLYLDGDGWSDSVPVIAAAGMTELWEAVINGLNFPTDIGEYLGIKDTVNSALEKKIAEIGANYPFDKWFRGNLEVGVSVDELVFEEHAGVWALTAGRAQDNSLPAADYGALTVKWVASTSSPYVVQTWEPVSTPGCWRRVQKAGGGWTPWTAGNTDKWFRGNLEVGVSVDELVFEEHAGVWALTAGRAQDNSLPAADYGALTVKWVASTSSPYVVQTWEPVSTPGCWRRVQKAGGGWTPWTKEGTAGSGAGAHAARYGDLVASRGGRIGTGGKPVISFRFDTNQGAFDNNILPLLRERSLPSTMACFYDMMNPQPGYSNDDSAAAGKTWTDLQNNFHRGVEIFSHSYSHQDAATPQELHREIVESRRIMEAVMPDVRVHGWDMPGVTGTQYMGWWDAWRETDTRVEHPAHSLLASTYATWNISGYGTNTLGVPETRYYGVEKYTLSQVKNLVAEALRTTTGLTLMMHPHQIGRTGYMSLETFTQMLDYVVELRDSGQVMVLSQGGQAVADPSTSWRSSLTPKLAGWAGDPSDKVSCTVPLGRANEVGGGMRELVVETTGTGALRLSVTAGDIMDVYQTVEVAPGKPGRLQIGVPRRANSLTLTAEVASGSPTITNIGLYGV